MHGASLESHTFVTIICHNDELSSNLTWLDCLQIDSLDFFILFADINQLILEIYFIPILLTFM